MSKKLQIAKVKITKVYLGFSIMSSSFIYELCFKLNSMCLTPSPNKI